MASLLSKLLDIFRPTADEKVAFDFGRDIAHEYLAYYHLIDKDSDAIGMAKFEKYVFIVGLVAYQDALVNNSEFSEFVDEIERDSIPKMANMIKSSYMLTYQTTAAEQIKEIVQWAYLEDREFNFAVIVGFMAVQRFRKKYKMIDDHCTHAIFAGVTDVIPSDI